MAETCPVNRESNEPSPEDLADSLPPTSLPEIMLDRWQGEDPEQAMGTDFDGEPPLPE